MAGRGDHEQLKSQEDLETGEEIEDVNPFHEVGPTNRAARSGLEERLLHALDLNGGGVKIEAADFHGKLHREDYLVFEASLENYFEWKPMAENRKVLFVKLKLKGTALQWWKRVEEQRAQQGKLKISTWQHMKTKLWKQFLPADYTMELYEGLHCLKQNNMSVEEYFAEFNNLSIPVGLSKTEKRVSRYGARKPIYRTNWQNNLGPRRGYQTGQREWKETTTTNKTNRGATNVEMSDKGKSIVPYGAQNNSGSSAAKGGNNFQVRCFTCGEKGHTSFACPQRRVNLVEFEEELELVFDEHDEEIEEIDVHAAERSMENIISKEAVDKLKLPTITHPHPYKVGWLKKGHEIPVTSQCLVKFTMGGNLDNEALCDIVPMDVGHILVGRPWLFDHDMDHKTKPNTYSFYKDNKRYTLYHLKEKAKQLATKSSTTSKITGYLSVEKFNAEHGEMGIMYALINKIVESDQVGNHPNIPLKSDNY
ncbi:hypothetical protein Pint_32911 [Pistacia integerrima]|uniref:Uncharacterized protein n=1 Tax=Pistacia integerrima TaxID=434235 RepID=A0ACC0X7Z8_9ROSI|nr:hypothetical protein Pint_32911 [Pistacia integerrima]